MPTLQSGSTVMKSHRTVAHCKRDYLMPISFIFCCEAFQIVGVSWQDSINAYRAGEHGEDLVRKTQTGQESYDPYAELSPDLSTMLPFVSAV